MADKIDDGGYAFPSPADDKSGWCSESGMTMRDYFAGQALVGMGTWMPEGFGRLNTDDAARSRAAFAYRQADAMIAARKGEE